MSNIKSIEVNGTTYGLESVTNFVVSPFEPTTAPLPELWIKPLRIYYFRQQLQFECKPNSSSYQGDYTLDSEGNLVETSDTTTSVSNCRATEMIDLFKDKQYKIAQCYSSNYSYDFAFSVYFYDNTGTFISKTSGSVVAGESVPVNTSILDFELPTGAYKVRFLIPYNYYSNVAVADRTVTDVSQNSMGSNNALQWYQLDTDHYVRL